MLLIIAFLPIISLLISLFIFKNLLKSAIFSYFVTIVLSLFYGIYFEKIIEAHLSSLFSSFRIFLLIFSLLLLFEFIEKKKIFSHFKQKNLKTFVTLGVFFTILLEGLVGFGTPGMLVTRTLLDMGFNPLHSALISLQADFTSHFGAFATPINAVKQFTDNLNFLRFVGIATSVLFLIPILFSIIFLREKPSIDIFIAYILFSILIITISSTQYFFLSLVISSSIALIFLFSENFKLLKEFSKFFYPFFLGIVIFLILNNIEYINVITKNLGIGIVFLIILLILFKNKINEKIISSSFTKSAKLFLIIFSLSYISYFFIISENNRNNLPGLINVITENAKVLKEYYIFLAPLIGVFGAFIFGSATVSNLTFFNIQKEIALALNLNVDKVLALQIIGAGIGNMISLYNIAAIVALSEKLKDKETEILKINFLASILAVFISFLLVQLL